MASLIYEGERIKSASYLLERRDSHSQGYMEFSLQRARKNVIRSFISISTEFQLKRTHSCGDPAFTREWAKLFCLVEESLQDKKSLVTDLPTAPVVVLWPAILLTRRSLSFAVLYRNSFFFTSSSRGVSATSSQRPHYEGEEKWNMYSYDDAALFTNHDDRANKNVASECYDRCWKWEKIYLTMTTMRMRVGGWEW